MLPHRRAARERGQAVVEAAIIVPSVVALFMLISIGGQLLSTELALTNAAGAAASAAAVAVYRGTDPQTAALQAVAAQGLSLACGGSPPGCVSVSSQTGTESGAPMEVVTVHDEVVPWWWSSGPIGLVAQAASAT